MGFFDNHRIFNIGATQVTVSVGATNAVLVEPIAGQVNIRVTQLSGSTLALIGVAEGTTLSAAQMVTLAAGSLPLSIFADKSLDLQGPSRFYLQAGGNTAVVASLLYGKTQGA